MKKFSLFLVALGACLLTFPEEVKAAPDTASYRLIVQYFDSIQIKYAVRHGIDEWWTTIGDVPIGVAKGGTNDSVTGQIYCIDATVPFHSYSGVKTSWPDGVTTDSVRNYVVATPFQYSDALRTNLDAILWLTVNGYTGHNLTAIQGNYGTNIDSTIALMATKIAIWHYTNERDFSLASTSLDTKDPARAAVMRQLVDALIRDAKVGATTFASLNVSIAKSTSPAAGFFPITLGPPEPVGDYYYYYGPFVVNESVSNGSGTFKLDSIFLSVGGVASEGVKFVKNSYGTPSTNIPLSEADMYGTSQKQPYVNNGDSFWLKIPVSRGEALGSATAAVDGIVIHALGKASNVEVTSSHAVPMVLVYQNPSTGVQDWNEVQAFIGLAREGEKVTLYGESLHPVYNSGYDPSLSEGELRISKRVTNGTDADRAARYTFRLAMFAGGQMLPVQLVPGHNITGSSGLSAVSEDGVFTLSDGGEVNIKHLPVIFGTYSLVETTDPSRYETSFKRGSGSERSAPGINMYLYPGVTSNTVSVTNNILQSPPSSPSPSGPPLTIVNKPFVPTGGTGTPHDPFEGRLILPCCPCPESLKASDISASEPADITFSVDATFTRETWSSCDLYTDAEVTLYFTVGFTDGSVYYYKAWLSKEALPLPTLVREVILPGVAGVTSNPPPGRHYIESGTNFKFTLTPDNSLLLAEAQLLVTTNRKGVPAADDVEITANGDGSYTYLIRSIRQALDISIEIVMPEEVAGSESVAGEKVWADSHTLYIYATQNGAARIYSITGQLAATVQCAAGETAQARLPAGIYAVKTATAVHKVVVR